jgi:phosphatidylglycerophosphate synthase
VSDDERRVELWTRAHAGSLLLAGALGIARGSALPATVVGAASLAALAVYYKGRWTASGAFGWANTVTALRLLLIAALGMFAQDVPSAWTGALVLFIFALDGFDGWLARRYDQVTEFGAVFDKESDALMLLICALLLYLEQRLGAYILLCGFLRYAYVLVVALMPAGGAEAPRSRLGRWTFGILTTSMAASLWPLEPWHRPAAVIATLVLCSSFAHSLFWSLRQVRRTVRPAAPPSS